MSHKNLRVIARESVTNVAVPLQSISVCGMLPLVVSVDGFIGRLTKEILVAIVSLAVLWSLIGLGAAILLGAAAHRADPTKDNQEDVLQRRGAIEHTRRPKRSGVQIATDESVSSEKAVTEGSVA
jgi:hypothetical protein